MILSFHFEAVRKHIIIPPSGLHHPSKTLFLHLLPNLLSHTPLRLRLRSHKDITPTLNLSVLKEDRMKMTHECFRK